MLSLLSRLVKYRGFGGVHQAVKKRASMTLVPSPDLVLFKAPPVADSVD
jgi:hypothetical protein